MFILYSLVGQYMSLDVSPGLFSQFQGSLRRSVQQNDQHCLCQHAILQPENYIIMTIMFIITIVNESPKNTYLWINMIKLPIFNTP